MGKPTLTPEQADVAMLQRAVTRIRGDKEPFLFGEDKVVYGLKAMDVWTGAMKRPAFQASDPGSSAGNATCCALYSCEGARDTCSYLRRRLVTFPETARPHIAAAADQYDFIWRTLAPFTVRGGYAAIMGDQARQTQHAEKVLAPCKEAMAKAAEHIEKALAAIDSRKPRLQEPVARLDAHGVSAGGRIAGVVSVDSASALFVFSGERHSSFTNHQAMRAD